MKMRLCGATIALSLTIPGATAAAAPAVPRDVQFTLPARFQGEWNENLAHCGTSLNDSRLRIGPTTIRFYESGGPVKAVVRRGEFEIIVVAELSGEGESWLAAHHFVLGSDGSYLNTPGDGGSDFTRYRCP